MSKFPDHKGKATLDGKLVPLEEFRAECARHGRQPRRRRTRRRTAERLVAVGGDGVEVEGPFERVLVFGGIYSNHYGLSAVLEAAERHRADAVYCLGDLGGFGPNPEKIWPLLTAAGVRCIQGNYEQSLATGHEDCNCGYTDP